jgi:hypothetical protein
MNYVRKIYLRTIFARNIRQPPAASGGYAGAIARGRGKGYWLEKLLLLDRAEFGLAERFGLARAVAFVELEEA